jgi:hypothetical protein
LTVADYPSLGVGDLDEDGVQDLVVRDATARAIVFLTRP